MNFKKKKKRKTGVGNIISLRRAAGKIFFKFTCLFFSHNKTHSVRNKAKSYHTQLLCFSITERLYFLIALKFSWTAASKRHIHCWSVTAINISSPIPSSRERARHKPAERVAVFMGKRVEKPLLSLICHKGDLWVCDVRTLFRLCIDSSRAGRRREA